MSAPNPHAEQGIGWHVTGQQQVDKVEGGNVVSGWEVSFLTQHGVAGSVFIPATRYNRGQVIEAINHQAATIDSIHGLQG